MLKINYKKYQHHFLFATMDLWMQTAGTFKQFVLSYEKYEYFNWQNKNIINDERTLWR